MSFPFFKAPESQFIWLNPTTTPWELWILLLYKNHLPKHLCLSHPSASSRAAQSAQIQELAKIVEERMREDEEAELQQLQGVAVGFGAVGEVSRSLGRGRSTKECFDTLKYWGGLKWSNRGLYVGGSEGINLWSLDP